MMEKRINNIVIDYGNEILIINGKKVDTPVIITIKESDGLDNKKLINSCETFCGRDVAEITIDAREFTQKQQKREVKELILQAIKESLPTKLSD